MPPLAAGGAKPAAHLKRPKGSKGFKGFCVFRVLIRVLKVFVSLEFLKDF